jgi:hypothetical protein
MDSSSSGSRSLGLRTSLPRKYVGSVMIDMRLMLGFFSVTAVPSALATASQAR